MIAQRLSEAPEYRLFASDDVEETRAQISAVMQPHELRRTRAGLSTRAQMSFLRLPNIGVGTISFGQMQVDLDRVDGYHLIVLCSRGQARVRLDNKTVAIGGAQGICVGPGEAFRAEFSHDCEQLVFRVDHCAMRRSNPGSIARLRDVLDLRAVELQPWISCVKMLLNDWHMMAAIQGNAQTALGFEQMFLATLIDGLGTRDEIGRRSLAPAAVKRAEAFIEDNLNNPIALVDIAAAAGVPVRTLLDSFQRFRNASPMRYLRDRRLDTVRVRLIADPTVTVTAAALDAGFTHLGRFSQAYRARFGAMPSERSRSLS